jgi:hypothetical protein
MNFNNSPEKPFSLNWSGTVLNVYTIGLLLIWPFWGAYLVGKGKGVVIIAMLILLGGLITLSLQPKPMFSYDVKDRRFTLPNGQSFGLDQLDSIEADTRDVYFIPKSHLEDGWHIKQKVWVLLPRRAFFEAARSYEWPVKDITKPLSRFGFWFMP